MVGSVRSALLVLTAAVALVLLTACVNVANLLLARGALASARWPFGGARRRTRTTRASVAHGEPMLAAAGGLLGIGLAWLGIRLLTRVGDASIPTSTEARIDTSVLAFSIAVSIIAGFLVGIIPALQHSRADIRGSLGDGSRGSSEGGSRRRLRAALVTAQVAMALIILVAAGLLGRELSRHCNGSTRASARQARSHFK